MKKSILVGMLMIFGLLTACGNAAETAPASSDATSAAVTMDTSVIAAPDTSTNDLDEAELDLEATEKAAEEALKDL